MTLVDLIRVLLIALYTPIVLLVYHRLYPRLSPMSKGLTTFMLAAQALAITLATAYVHHDSFVAWLWDLDEEFNLPSTLASTQLALIGFISLLTAWRAKSRQTWQRLYFVGLFVVFIHFARDEFFQFRYPASGWEISYAQLGVAIALATALLWLRSPRRQRIWSLCVLAGLAIGALGALVIEDLRHEQTCSQLGFVTDRCLIYFPEEALEFLGMWLALVGMLGFFSEAAPQPDRRWRLVYLLPILWVIMHHAPFVLRYAEFTSDAATSAVTRYQSGLELRIFRLDQDQDGVSAQFYAATNKWRHFNNLGYSLHLVDQVSGASIAGVNAGAHHYDPAPYPLYNDHNRYIHIYKQQLEVGLPSSPRNRALWIVFTSWIQDGDQFTYQQAQSSDFPLLGSAQALLGELVIRADAAPATVDPVAKFDKGLTLEAADIPAQAIAGQTLSITFTWRSSEASIDDLAQFLHLHERESGNWWSYDQQPLGARLPTRLWYSGLVDSETWRIPLPADLKPGDYTVFTGLYRLADLERLPAKAADGTPYPDARVPLSRLTIESPQW